MVMIIMEWQELQELQEAMTHEQKEGKGEVICGKREKATENRKK
jgi:hypothetical protein